MPTDPVPSPMSSSSSVIYAFFHSLHSPVRGAPCHPSRDMPLLSSLPLSRQWSRREREPLMDFGADRPTAPLDGRPLPPYSPPLDTECDCTGCAWDDSRLNRTLWRRSASSNGPFCASTCGFVMVVCQGTSWHLGANRHPKSACRGFLLDNNLPALLRPCSCSSRRPPSCRHFQSCGPATSTPPLQSWQQAGRVRTVNSPTGPLFPHTSSSTRRTAASRRPPLHRDAHIAAHLCAGVCCTQRNDRRKGSVGFRHV